MTEEQINQCYDVSEQFLIDVREAFRKAKASLSEEQLDYIIFRMQDGLSLFSPWMNAEDDE